MTYSTLLAFLQSRRSIRRFADAAVEDADVERIVEAARWAPSNHNRQGWKFLVWRDREAIRGLAAAVRDDLTHRLAAVRDALRAEIGHATAFEGAPCLVLVLHKRPTAVSAEATADALVSGEPLSAAMAVQNMLLAAHALGLGACMFTAPLLARGVFDSLPDLPPGFVPTALVALGHPAEQPAPPRRKSLAHILEYRDRGATC